MEVKGKENSLSQPIERSQLFNKYIRKVNRFRSQQFSSARTSSVTLLASGRSKERSLRGVRDRRWHYDKSELPEVGIDFLLAVGIETKVETVRIDHGLRDAD